MIALGRYNQLTVVKITEFGIFLDGGKFGNILLPKRYVNDTMVLGSKLNLFIHLDSDDSMIATTLTPKAQVGECAYLPVKDVNAIGAFLDWGLAKDLLVPFSEQQQPMKLGESYVVYIYLDAYTGRITASSRLSRHLEERAYGFTTQQEVDLLICGKSDLGYKAVVNHTHLGLIFRDDALRPMQYGEQIKGFIKNIRPDKKIDLSLQQKSTDAKSDLAEKIIHYLKKHQGVGYLTDKSDPSDIYQEFKVSKGNYKNALSLLYKQRRILITPEKITLVTQENK
jgi:uncharacterized protein